MKTDKMLFTCFMVSIYQFCFLNCLLRKTKMAAVPLMLVEEDVERGGKEQSEHDIQDDFAYRNNVHNADIKIRMGNV